MIIQYNFFIIMLQIDVFIAIIRQNVNYTISFYCRMAKSKAQRMKEYRARKKAELGDAWLKRENQRVKGYFVPISELSEEKQTHKRKLNKNHCETYRKKQKTVACDETIESGENNKTNDALEDENAVSLIVKMRFNTPKESSRQSRGRIRVSRALAKQYRKNKTLQDENESLKRKLNSVRKRLNRMENKQRSAPSTPRSKSDKLLRDAGLEPKRVPGIRQKLLFAECLSEEIKEAKTANNQNVVMRIVSGKIIKKYKMKKALGTSTRLDRRKLNNLSKSVTHVEKRTRNAMINSKITREIHEFLSRDDNSRVLPGKADAIKVGSDKVQKRVLNDYMYNLHTKFLAETSYKVSRSAFYHKKPRSIAHVNFSSRSVCLCQKHQNFALKLRCLKNYKVTFITSPDKFMEVHSNEDLNKILSKIQETSVRYQEWKKMKMKDGKQKMRVVDLDLPTEEFKEMMKKTHTEFASHIHKVIQQYKGVKVMKEKLPANHVLVQMDFSENYCCQNMEEVQSAYWNATAITLHPTVMYKRNINKTIEHKSIVYVSEILQHNASMVLAIVEKVIATAKKFVDELEAIHFWTDSPTSQYRNKTIFNFLSNLEKSHGITGSWQFFESGHGKGPCDGIGGTTKRNADNAIKQGKFIIQDADDFFKWASETDSQIEYEKIEQTEFIQSQEKVEKENMNIKPIKGTMKIHSVVAASPGIVRTRETTCVCDNCFKENGFVENSQCLWLEQNLSKPIREIQNSERQVNIEDKDADQETTVQVIESPKPTGRTQRIFSVNENILAYMLEIK